MKQKLLVILGTTSTGKTDLAIKLAKKLNGELVSADSRQVYKHLDIGTGKLPGNYDTLEKGDGFWEIDSVKVWMYDVINPEIRFNLYEYLKQTSEIIKGIMNRGKLPILVGGTGLYIRSLLDGITNFGIAENSDLREELEELELGDIRKRINPETLSKLNNSDINNKRRLIRLVELSVNSEEKGEAFEGLEKDYDVLKIGLATDRSIIKERINHRLMKRINEGMIEESKELLEKGILTYKRMEELGLEYRYLAKLIKGEIKSTEEFLNILTIKISQFAKRQETWFKKDEKVVWFDISDPDFYREVEMEVGDWYNSK